MREINFLEQNLRKAATQAKADRKYLLGAAIFLVVVVVIWLSILGYNSYVTGQTNKVNAQSAALEKELLTFSTYQIDYMTFINKVKGISEIIALRNNAIPLIAYTSEFLSSDSVFISMISYSMQEKYFSMNFSIDNVFEAEKLFVKMMDLDFRSKFLSIDYSSLSRTQAGTYSTTFTFNL